MGYGAGERDFASTPNVLRVFIGRATGNGVRPTTERVTVIECEIDDMNPQLFGVAMARLYEAGALEVFYVPVQMKKNRPGTLLTVVTAPELRSALVDIIFKETTTIGLRHHDVDRECLAARAHHRRDAGGRRESSRSRGARDASSTRCPSSRTAPRLATATNLSVKEVQALAMKAYGSRPDSPDRPS